MLLRIYERLLEFQISRRSVPNSIAVVFSTGDLDMRIATDLLSWSEDLGIGHLALYIGEEGPDLMQRISSWMKDAPADVSLHTNEGVIKLGSGGKVKMVISLGFGGKREVAEALKKIMRRVEAGEIEPEEVDEALIEANLRFRQKPDLVIRAGGRQLSDFMIWQAAYSELYFTEVTWPTIRKVELLRAVRDYQKRERRFGK
jgi:undecaprenyl diphosphate synthase